MAELINTPDSVIHVKLSPASSEQLAQLATSRNISMTDLATKALSDYVDSLPEEEEATAMIAQMSSILDNSLKSLREIRASIQGDLRAMDQRAAEQIEQAA